MRQHKAPPTLFDPSELDAVAERTEDFRKCVFAAAESRRHVNEALGNFVNNELIPLLKEVGGREGTTDSPTDQG